jgi:hypothetical protein
LHPTAAPAASNKPEDDRWASLSTKFSDVGRTAASRMEVALRVRGHSNPSAGRAAADWPLQGEGDLDVNRLRSLLDYNARLGAARPKPVSDSPSMG